MPWHNGVMEESKALTDNRLVGLDFEVVTHGKVASLEEAAALRGVEPSQVVKTMVVRRGEGDYVFALVPGDRVIDWAKFRALLGQRRLSMPDAEEALAVTGYVRGTITPFGSTHDWPVYADAHLAETIVSIGGGAHGVSLTVDGRILIDALDATVAEFTKPKT